MYGINIPPAELWSSSKFSHPITVVGLVQQVIKAKLKKEGGCIYHAALFLRSLAFRNKLITSTWYEARHYLLCCLESLQKHLDTFRGLLEEGLPVQKRMQGGCAELILVYQI